MTYRNLLPAIVAVVTLGGVAAQAEARITPEYIDNLRARAEAATMQQTLRLEADAEAEPTTGAQAEVERDS